MQQIKTVSFFVWENKRVTHKQEIVKDLEKITGLFSLGDSVLIARGTKRIFDKLKEKYGNSIINIRKVWDYV